MDSMDNNMTIKQVFCALKRSIRKLFIGAVVITISGCEIFYGAVLMASCGVSFALKITPETLPPAILNQPYNVELTVSEYQLPISNFNLSSGQLPKGLEFLPSKSDLHDDTATIKGIPTEVGSFPITVNAGTFRTQCSPQEGIQNYSIKIHKES